MVELKMVELVYFGEELAQRAPLAAGVIYSAMHREWITAMQAVEAVRLAIPISIRPATEAEKKRVETIAALYEVGAQLGERIKSILDEHQEAAIPPAPASETASQTADAPAA